MPTEQHSHPTDPVLLRASWYCSWHSTFAILLGQESGEVQVGWGVEGGPGQGGQSRGGMLKKGKLRWMVRT